MFKKEDESAFISKVKSLLEWSRSFDFIPNNLIFLC